MSKLKQSIEAAHLNCGFSPTQASTDTMLDYEQFHSLLRRLSGLEHMALSAQKYAVPDSLSLILRALEAGARELGNELHEAGVKTENKAVTLTPADALECLTAAFGEDRDPGSYWHTWFANIAMAIYDSWPDKGRKIDKCNAAAKYVMQTIFDRRKG
jgi:hypothetical protein